MTNAPTTVPSETEKERATAWFYALRDQLCATFEGLEDAVPGSKETSAQAPGRFERSAWQRNPGDDEHGSSLMCFTNMIHHYTECFTNMIYH